MANCAHRYEQILRLVDVDVLRRALEFEIEDQRRKED